MNDFEKRISQATEGRKIREYEPTNLALEMVKLLPRFYIITGFQMPMVEDMTLIARKLATDLLESYAFLSVEEVELCFELGARGQYGDFAGLNLRTFHRWLRIYKTSEARPDVPPMAADLQDLGGPLPPGDAARDGPGGPARHHAGPPAGLRGPPPAKGLRHLPRAEGFRTPPARPPLRPAAGTGADRRHARGEAGGDGPLREPRRASGATATGGLRFPSEAAGDGMVAGTLFRPVDRQWSTNTRLMTRWSTTPHAAGAIFATYSRTI